MHLWLSSCEAKSQWAFKPVNFVDETNGKCDNWRLVTPKVYKAEGRFRRRRSKIPVEQNDGSRICSRMWISLRRDEEVTNICEATNIDSLFSQGSDIKERHATTTTLSMIPNRTIRL